MTRERAVVGSGAESDFVIDHATVSRRHAQIVKRRSAYVLRDLGSTNGTYLNGRRLAPNIETALSHHDEIRFGLLRFRFEIPAATAPPSRARAPRMIAILITALIIAASIVFYFSGRTYFSHPPVLVNAPPSAPPTLGLTWMERLNYYRALTHLAPVNEDFALSKGDANHARYLIANKADMIRRATIDASIHEEDPGNPFFTPEGKAAGGLSDVDLVYTDPPEPPDPPWAIENWITGPFHRMWLLNPALRAVGYGQYCERGICAAALNIRSGIATPSHGATSIESGASIPVMFPPNAATIRNGAFSAQEVEWPDPLASCGYVTPSGVPISLQIGGNAPAQLEQSSLSRKGTVLESCAFDASSYRSTDPIALSRARGELSHFGAIILVPKEPLVRGAAYTVSIKASGQLFSWRFSVAP